MFKLRRSWVWALPLIIFMGVAGLLWKGLYQDPRAIPSPLINKPVPEFQAPNLINPKLTFSSKDFKGKVTLLNVFASWCIACSAEHSVWMEARQDLGQAQIVGLNYKDPADKALAWLKQYGNPYQNVIADPQGNIAINFGVYGTPETFLIDKQGIIRYKFIGAVSPKDWQEVLLPQVKKWNRADEAN